jgi:GntR family transcriptional regulator
VPKAPYKVLVDEITEKIADGRLQEGDRLPSAKELAQEYGLHRSTADCAYLILDDRWLVEGRPGSGRFVARGARRFAQERLRMESERASRRDGPTEPGGVLLQ